MSVLIEIWTQKSIPQARSITA